jgi:hypothetical protein
MKLRATRALCFFEVVESNQLNISAHTRFALTDHII